MALFLKGVWFIRTLSPWRHISTSQTSWRYRENNNWVSCIKYNAIIFPSLFSSLDKINSGMFICLNKSALDKFQNLCISLALNEIYFCISWGFMLLFWIRSSNGTVKNGYLFANTVLTVDFQVKYYIVRFDWQTGDLYYPNPHYGIRGTTCVIHFLHHWNSR